MAKFFRQEATYGGGRRNIGVGSRTQRRKEYTTGLTFGRHYGRQYTSGPGKFISGQRGSIRQFLAGKGGSGGPYSLGLKTPTARAGAVRAFERMTSGGNMRYRAGPGANLGSFKHRKGSWAKGKGGRFIGSG